LFEPAQRFSKRRSANPEFAGELLLNQTGSGPKVTRHDRLSQNFGCAIH
jgi:hypothetical protein